MRIEKRERIPFNWFGLRPWRWTTRSFNGVIYFAGGWRLTLGWWRVFLRGKWKPWRIEEGR